MKTPRFLFVGGVGSGPAAHPAWPDIHQPFVGELDPDGSWVAWRLTGANHRELGRSTRVFPDLGKARQDAMILHSRVADAHAQIVTIPKAGTWRWQMTLDDVIVATSSRGYARQRECTYNVQAFASAAAVAELAEHETQRSWQLVGPRIPIDDEVLTRVLVEPTMRDRKL